MSGWDFVGYLASSLVLASFCMKSMMALRIVAICSNLVFIAYGTRLGLEPIWLLHSVLLPLNSWRLYQVTGIRAEVAAYFERYRRLDVRGARLFTVLRRAAQATADAPRRLRIPAGRKTCTSPSDEP